MRLCATLIVGLLAAGAPRALAEDAPSRTVEILAKDNRFKVVGMKKGPLVLKAGEAVKFKITAFAGTEKAPDGAVHSFAIRKLLNQGWNVRLMEGAQEFTLTAPPPGEYLIECTVICGEGHENMNLKLVVQP